MTNGIDPQITELEHESAKIAGKKATARTAIAFQPNPSSVFRYFCHLAFSILHSIKAIPLHPKLIDRTIFRISIQKTTKSISCIEDEKRKKHVYINKH